MNKWKIFGITTLSVVAIMYLAFLFVLPNAVDVNKFKPEIHLNLFAKEPDNETIICYNKASTKYMPEELHGIIKRAGTERRREYSVDYVNEFIKTANDNGYLVAYNHPGWSMEDEERILLYENLFSLEMYNTSSFVTNNLENGEVLYDKMLRRGMRIGCHAGDDNHNKHPFDSPYNDSCGWYTVFLADKLEYSSIISAMNNKDFYASNGPEFHELSIIDNETLHIECSPASKVFLYYGTIKSSASIRLPKGEMRSSFDIRIPSDAKFVRVTIYDDEGHVANSRGYFPDEWY